MSAEVVLYGASGYTGKLIAWHLAENGIPFIAAGRNRERLQEQMAKAQEELDIREYEVKKSSTTWSDRSCNSAIR